MLGDVGSGGGAGVGARAGLIPRAAAHVFARCAEEEKQGWRFEFSVSMLEVYNDALRDLMPGTDDTGAAAAAAGAAPTLELRLSKETGQPYPSGLVQHAVSSVANVLALLEAAAKRRNVRNNGRNAQSSRAHSVFTLRIKRTRDQLHAEGAAAGNGSSSNNSHSSVTEGVLNLIDLAGSERLSP